MSEQGWQDFLGAEGLADWVVLHGGPTAVFRTSSLAEAAGLAQSIAQLPELDERHLQLNIVAEFLTVRLTREIWNIETAHVALARAISELAGKAGVSADPSRVQEVQIAIAAKSDAINLEFWQAVLGYDRMLDDNAVDPLGNSSTVWMQDLDSDKPLAHAMHLDVSVSQRHIRARLEAALAAGGRIVDESHAPSYWILADPSGNKVCIVAWPDGATDSQ